MNNTIKRAIDRLTLSAGIEASEGRHLMNVDPKQEGYTSWEHLVACHFGVASIDDKTSATDLRTVNVKIKSDLTGMVKTVKVQAIIQRIRRAITIAKGGSKPADKTVTVQKIHNRVQRLVDDCKGADMVLALQVELQKQLRGVDEYLKAEADKGHQNADKVDPITNAKAA